MALPLVRVPVATTPVQGYVLAPCITVFESFLLRYLRLGSSSLCFVRMPSSRNLGILGVPSAKSLARDSRDLPSALRLAKGALGSSF